MFSVEQNLKAPKLQHPVFTVDHKLKEVAPPFPSVHSYMVFCAASRSGKTSLMLSILNHRKLYKKAYHTIFVVMPIHSLTSIKEDENILLDLPDDQIYNDLDYDTLSEIYHRILHLSSEGYDSLIIIDDMMSALKNPQLLKLFNQIISNRRHYKCSIWCLTQVYNAINLSNRKTINYLVLYKLKNKKEIKSVYEEMITGMTYDEFVDMLDFAFDQPYNWLMIDRDNNTYWKKFDRIIIHNNFQ